MRALESLKGKVGSKSKVDDHAKTFTLKRLLFCNSLKKKQQQTKQALPFSLEYVVRKGCSEVFVFIPVCITSPTVQLLVERGIVIFSYL